MSSKKPLSSRILTVMAILIAAGVFFSFQAYAGATYEYYPSGNIKSVTYDPPVDGIAYVEYSDEVWEDGHGRIERKVLSSADADGALSYEYENPLRILLADLNGDGWDDLFLEYSFGFYKYVNGSLSKITTALPSDVLKADIDGDTRDDLILKYDFGLYKYVNGVFSKITTSLPDEMGVADLDGDGTSDLILSYAFGLHKYVNGTFSRITESQPESILTLNLDGDAIDDLVLKYEFGLYKYVNGTFSNITGSLPSEIIVADLNGNGNDDLVLKYSFGCYKYVDGSFSKITTSIPDSVMVADLDGNGADDLVLEYDFGLHKYVNGSFSKITTTLPANVMVADLDGNGSDDLVLEYSFGLHKYVDGVFSRITESVPDDITVADLDGDGADDLVLEYAFGLYKYAGGSFSKITTTLPDEVIVADLDGDGKDDLVLKYGYGLHKYVDGVFSKITTTVPDKITVADLNGDGKDDLVLEYSYGLYKYVGGTFTKITESLPLTMSVADLDGDGADDLVLEYDFGLHTYAGGTLTKISSSLTESVTTQYAYSNSDYTNLLYTATYDSDGTPGSFYKITDTGHKIYEYDLDGNVARLSWYDTSDRLVEERIAIDRQVPSPRQEEFISVGNLAWSNYGYDLGFAVSDEGFGTHDGYSAQPERLRQKLEKWQGGYVRLFLFCDFRAGVEFADGTDAYKDGEGNTLVSGTPVGFFGTSSGDYTSAVYNDMAELLAAAEEMDIKLIPTLFDYRMADGTEDGWCGEHRDLIEDPDKRKALVDIFRPFIREFGDHEAVYAWDVMNEPEMSCEGRYEGEPYDPVSFEGVYGMKEFCKRFIKMIHEETLGAKVTVGSFEKGDMMRNWVEPDPFDPERDLDVLQFHYYDNMKQYHPDDYERLDHHREDLNDLLSLGGRPVIAGELDPTGVTHKLDILANNGYDGGLFWDDTGNPEWTVSEEEMEEINDWFFGIFRKYYPGSGNLAVELSPSLDGTGSVYCKYADGNIGGGGHGLLQEEVLASYDANGARAYRYEYYDSSEQTHYRYMYHTGDYTDLMSPVFSELMVVEEYDFSGELVGTDYCRTRYADTGYLRTEFFDGPAYDGYGNSYKYYFNEQWNGGHGREYVEKNENDGKVYKYAYAGDSYDRTEKWEYTGVDITDPNDPVPEGFQVAWMWYGNADKRYKGKLLPSADGEGNIYYHHLDEAYYDNGTPEDTDDYGRMDIKVLETPSGGVKAYEYGYRPGTTEICREYQYANCDLSSPSEPELSGLLKAWHWDESGNVIKEIDAVSGKETLWYSDHDGTDFNFMAKEVHADSAAADAGSVYTYFRDAGGSWKMATQVKPYDPGLSSSDIDNGSFTEYLYDASDELVGAYVHSRDRTSVWELDASLEVVETFLPLDRAFASGFNLPWVDYGKDLGIITTGGSAGEHHGFSSTAGFNALVDKMEEKKGTTVRVFLFGDFRSGVEFNAEGYPVRFTDKVYDDMRALIDVARMFDVSLIPVLLDFTVADNVSEEEGNPVGERPELITDPSRREALISLMEGFVEEFRDSEEIYAWEIMNEPEMCNQHGMIMVSEIQEFVREFILALHEADDDTPVTLGSQKRNFMEEYWTDASLGVDPEDGLDIYQYHYYNNFESSYPLDHPASAFDKPVIVGEIDPTIDGDNDSRIAEKMTTVYDNGYSGGLFWDDEGDYPLSPEEIDEVRTWNLDGKEYYPSENLKRVFHADGDITEYEDEEEGRVILYYDAYQMKYWTYEWLDPESMVRETLYSSDYEVDEGDPAGYDVTTSERALEYVYDHGGDTDVHDNEWFWRKKVTWSGSSWNRVDWRRANGNPLKELHPDGEAKLFYDAPGCDMEAYWDISGTVSGYNENGRDAWYMDGSLLEVYSYWDNGQMKYKDLYVDDNGTWTWWDHPSGENAASWDEYGNWDGWKTRSETGASLTYDIPEKPAQADLDSAGMFAAPEISYIDGAFESFCGDIDNLSEVFTGSGVSVALLDSSDGSVGHALKTSGVIKKTASGASLDVYDIFDDNLETDNSLVGSAVGKALEAGARIIAMPFSLFPVSSMLENIIERAVKEGVIFIASAGNGGTKVMESSLASNENVITVGSVDNDGKLSAWSNYGEEVDLYAPWDVIEIAASPSAPRNDARPGTSFSAAFVAGIAALVLEDNPDMTAGEVLAELREILAPIQVEAKVEAEKEVK
ncbi:MAG: S8 family serine peptidase, partial [Candidatus Omnitrophica bacterium]|nr:S8 family serine peptidase [Candidatus Omnitrophota bacterium]